MPARLAHLEFLHQRVLLGPYPAGVRASAEPADRCAARSGRDGVLEIAVDGAHHDVTFRAYIDSFYEQLDEAEKDLPEEAAAGLVY